MLNKREEKMFTSKQRSNLKGLAQKLEPIAQVGKGGITDNAIVSLSDALEARELIKISVLNNAEDTTEIVASKLADSLKAEIVTCIGKKIILYRKSKRQNFKHLEF
jgi:RNA-binding protein